MSDPINWQQVGEAIGQSTSTDIPWPDLRPRAFQPRYENYQYQFTQILNWPPNPWPGSSTAERRWRELQCELDYRDAWREARGVATAFRAAGEEKVDYMKL